MTIQPEVTQSSNTIVLNVISWMFGILFFAIGFVNTFWGNDPGFGIFIVLLSLLYFPPVTALIKAKTRLHVPRVLKFFLAVFILWASLGVGELFSKVDMMLASF